MLTDLKSILTRESPLHELPPQNGLRLAISFSTNPPTSSGEKILPLIWAKIRASIGSSHPSRNIPAKALCGASLPGRRFAEQQVFCNKPELLGLRMSPISIGSAFRISCQSDRSIWIREFPTTTERVRLRTTRMPAPSWRALSGTLGSTAPMRSRRARTTS